jgi:hypothetical protein
MARKTAAQLDREIAAALAGKPLRASIPSSRHVSMGTNGEAMMRFRELIREDDPSAMRVAEDTLLSSGWKMREATGGLRARNFTIEMKPMWGPREEWKMVQTNVAAGLDIARRPDNVWVKWSAANGSARAEREREYKLSRFSPGSSGDIDDVKQMAVATAWAIAKTIKPLPMDVSEKELKKIVDAAIRRGKKNVVPEELF